MKIYKKNKKVESIVEETHKAVDAMPAPSEVDMAKDEGITRKTLDTVKQAMGIVIKRVGFGTGSQCFWQLEDQKDDPVVSQPIDSHSMGT